MVSLFSFFFCFFLVSFVNFFDSLLLSLAICVCAQLHTARCCYVFFNDFSSPNAQGIDHYLHMCVSKMWCHSCIENEHTANMKKRIGAHRCPSYPVAFAMERTLFLIKYNFLVFILKTYIFFEWHGHGHGCAVLAVCIFRSYARCTYFNLASTAYKANRNW